MRSFRSVNVYIYLSVTISPRFSCADPFFPHFGSGLIDSLAPFPFHTLFLLALHSVRDQFTPLLLRGSAPPRGIQRIPREVQNPTYFSDLAH
jgi:hypothetical protein